MVSSNRLTLSLIVNQRRYFRGPNDRVSCAPRSECSSRQFSGDPVPSGSVQVQTPQSVAGHFVQVSFRNLELANGFARFPRRKQDMQPLGAT